MVLNEGELFGDFSTIDGTWNKYIPSFTYALEDNTQLIKLPGGKVK